MSDELVDGTLIQMRTLRRFSHYKVGEMIAVPIDAARDLQANRLAQPLQMLVPVAATPTEPLRQTAQVVKK